MTFAQEGDRVLLEIRDTGIGIPEDKRERIFDAFVQLGSEPVPRNDRGVGLGLAVSRERVRAMGGDLYATSRLCEGSRFTITFLRPPGRTPRSSDGHNSHPIARRSCLPPGRDPNSERRNFRRRRPPL